MLCNNSYYNLVVNRWSGRFMGRNFPVSIGKGGIAAKRGEGDSITPVGEFGVENWYYRPDRIQPAQHWVPISSQMGWCDDPQDAAYNIAVTRPCDASHEVMRRGDRQYDIVGIVDYNRNPIIPGAGSAIFIHAWRKPRHPTAGCVALPPRVLEYVARNWRLHSRLVVKDYP